MLKTCRETSVGSWLLCDARELCTGFIPVEEKEAPVEEVFENFYACKHFVKKGDRLDFGRRHFDEVEEQKRGGYNIQPTVTYCEREEQDIFFDSNKDLKEHCRFCPLCQKHELPTVREYRRAFGLGAKSAKIILI